MAAIRDVYDVLDAFAPFSTQMDFDNAGFLVGRGEREVAKILLSLDITLPVVEEAKRLGAGLVVSHHPVLFHPAKTVCSGDPTGEILLALIENGIGAICAHTNLDVAVGGVNDALAQALGLQNIQILLPDGTDAQGRPYGLGRVGELQHPVSLPAFAEQVKAALNAGGVRCVDGGRPVSKVAVGGGACGGCLQDAWRQGCDVLVTSDVKYDVFLEAKARGISLIDAGHYPTENVVLPKLKEVLEAAFPELEILTSAVHKEVFFTL